MLKPINIHNKCSHCLPISDFGVTNAMGYGCDYFDDMSILGDTPCTYRDYTECPNWEKENE